MAEYREVERVLEVPRGTGRDGLLRTVASILKQPRVQEIVIRSNGQVAYRRYARDDEADEIASVGLDLSSLMPYAVIRNSAVREIEPLAGANAAVVTGQLFGAASADGYKPVALALSPDTRFIDWHQHTTGIAVRRDEAYGTAIVEDPDIPDDVVILCAAYSREARLIDTRICYKVSIPSFGGAA